MKIKIRGLSYHYEIHQKDEGKHYLLMLHGFLGNGDSFNHLLPSLKTFCNPVTVDLLGHGRTEGAELHYRFSTREQVADLLKLISEQLYHPLYLYGYSMGGRLALQLALHDPKLFSALILESSTFGIENDTERQARQSLDAQRCDQIIGNYEGFLEEWKKMPLFGKPINTDLTKEMYKAHENQNPLWMSNSLQGFGTGTMPCVRERLKEFHIPVQLIVGEQDNKFLHINRQIEKEIKDCTLKVVPNAMHRVHVEQPDIVVETIRNFMV